MIALILGTVITLAALALVLQPLFVQSAPPRGEPAPTPATNAASQRAIAALREVEFDRETGKLSPQDYEELKAIYTREAVEAMRSERVEPASHPAAGLADDEVEAVIRRYRSTGGDHAGAGERSCAECGPRPEGDAVYCSSCGLFLASGCPTCGDPITEPGARFCSSCGGSLSAGVLQSASG